MNAAHGWFISSDRWSCDTCNRTVHRWLRESDGSWAVRLRDAQERHGRAHRGAL